jgi:hypothetical protein
MRLLLGHTIGLSTTAYLRSQEFDWRYEFSEGEQRNLDDCMAAFERRLARLEERAES